MHFFGTLQIEDLYIPYFCVSTDLRDSRARTHMSGDLWFYTRASMTLTLLFPPQINQFDTHLLMDGGYSDLVPAMAMRRLGIKYLIAINIGDEGSLHTFNIGYHVSGLHCILQNLLPYSTDRIPFNLQIWDSLLNCSARNFIQAYTALDFKNYTELRNAGYLSTKVITGDETKHSP
ncbi:Patatin-like phospholipase domain-containing protein 7 [Orchesella cincta]|uniref:Patatin-like phospholipase domain-containing protein 7 n=1 Tax=Orchesella cincta TaxID=48709 RepID=A0A1D2N3F2_ORCCI|nr:Patatin-like phospholipase domain-containing protein 7 [Orchesella cincta]